MFINQMEKIGSIGELKFTNQVTNLESQESGTLFKDIFESAVNNVIETENVLANEEYLLATGQTDDVHNLMIASTKAQLSVDMMIQLRNRALDSYSELMRINL